MKVKLERFENKFGDMEYFIVSDKPLSEKKLNKIRNKMKTK